VAEQTRLDAPGSRPTLYDPRRTPASSPGRDGPGGPPYYRAAGTVTRTGGNDVLELQGLTRRYGDLVVLDDLSFTVRDGQMFGFVGPNGAGKTTAMRIMRGR
jgi:ABC-type multidrug transport system fused ATPase/permease subunit